MLASYLPSSILDALINLPHFLISVRNGLLPTTPTRMIPADQLPPPETQKQEVATKTQEGSTPPSPSHAKVESAATVTDKAQDEESSSGDEIQSSRRSNDDADADVESNAGDTSVVESSWINLHEKHD